MPRGDHRGNRISSFRDTEKFYYWLLNRITVNEAALAAAVAAIDPDTSLADNDQILTGERIISGDDTNTLDFNFTDGFATTNFYQDGSEVGITVDEAPNTTEMSLGNNLTLLSSSTSGDSSTLTIDPFSINIEFNQDSEFHIDGLPGEAGQAFISGGLNAPPVWGIPFDVPTESAAGNYTVLASDRTIFKTGITGGGDTVTLLNNPSDGQELTIKDTSGLAGTNNITIDTAGPALIDGSATAVINGNYNSITVKYSSNSGNYNIISIV